MSILDDILAVVNVKFSASEGKERPDPGSSDQPCNDDPSSYKIVMTDLLREREQNPNAAAAQLYTDRNEPGAS